MKLTKAQREKELAEMIATPRFMPGEEGAIVAVKSLGALYGYGNLIDVLKNAWSERLQQNSGLDRQTADMAAGHICVWCKVDRRNGKKIKRGRQIAEGK